MAKKEYFGEETKAERKARKLAKKELAASEGTEKKVRKTYARRKKASTALRATPRGYVQISVPASMAFELGLQLGRESANQ